MLSIVAQNHEDFVDSCIDVTSPTPSNSTSEASKDSSKDPQSPDQEGSSLATRPAPLGCSGSSEEGRNGGISLMSSKMGSEKVFEWVLKCKGGRKMFYHQRHIFVNEP